jgi:hypothetical protein
MVVEFVNALVGPVIVTGTVIFAQPEFVITTECEPTAKPETVNTPLAKVPAVAVPPSTVYEIILFEGIAADKVIVADPLLPPKQVTAVVLVTVPTVAHVCDVVGAVILKVIFAIPVVASESNNIK